MSKIISAVKYPKSEKKNEKDRKIIYLNKEESEKATKGEKTKGRREKKY